MRLRPRQSADLVEGAAGSLAAKFIVREPISRALARLAPLLIPRLCRARGYVCMSLPVQCTRGCIEINREILDIFLDCGATSTIGHYGGGLRSVYT